MTILETELTIQQVLIQMIHISYHSIYLGPYHQSVFKPTAMPRIMKLLWHNLSPTMILWVHFTFHFVYSIFYLVLDES